MTTDHAQNGDPTDTTAQLAPDYQFVLVEARRGFDQLDTELGRIRDRACTLLSMGGIVAAFLGGLALRVEDAVPSGWTYAAAAAFGILGFTTVYVLIPRKMWGDLDPEKLIAWADTYPPSEINKKLATAINKKYDENKLIIEWLGWVYSVGVIAFSAEIIFLLVDFTTR